jgi:hypothetical protein
MRDLYAVLRMPRPAISEANKLPSGTRRPPRPSQGVSADPLLDTKEQANLDLRKHKIWPANLRAGGETLIATSRYPALRPAEVPL